MATNIVGISSGDSFFELMKRLQPQREVDRLWSLRYPFLNSVKKAGDFFGTQIDVPLEHDHPSRSRVMDATVSGSGTGLTSHGAVGGRYPSSSVKYNLTRVKDYATGQLDAETMHASSNDMGAWVRSLQRATQNTVRTLQKSSAIGLYRNHGGAIGQISVIGNGDGTDDRLTLTRKSDVVNFSRGQQIQFSVADGTSGALRDGGLSVVVRKVSFDNGYVYVGSDIDTAVDVNTAVQLTAANDYIFNAGDFGGSFRGLDSWIPLTAPSSGENFLGIDRSTDEMRLSGHRLNDTTMSIEEIIQELAARILYSGGADLTCYMAPIQVKQLALELDTKVVRDPGGKGKAGFSGVLVSTTAGDVEVIGDPACPEDKLYLLDMSCWMFHHLKAFPHLVEDDGLQRVRIAAADRVEFRYRLWGNLSCTAPGKNGVAALPIAF